MISRVRTRSRGENERSASRDDDRVLGMGRLDVPGDDLSDSAITERLLVAFKILVCLAGVCRR